MTRSLSAAYVTVQRDVVPGDTLTGVSVFDPISLNLRTESAADRLNAERVNPQYSSLLGVELVKGRTFTADSNPRFAMSRRDTTDKFPPCTNTSRPLSRFSATI